MGVDRIVKEASAGRLGFKGLGFVAFPSEPQTPKLNRIKGLARGCGELAKEAGDSGHLHADISDRVLCLGNSSHGLRFWGFKGFFPDENPDTQKP